MEHFIICLNKLYISFLQEYMLQDILWLCFDVLCLAIQSILHIFFICRLTEKAVRFSYFAIYFSILCVLEYTVGKTFVVPALVIIGQLFILCGVSHFVLKNRWSVSWIASIQAVYVSQLSFGIVNSLETILFPHLIGTPFLYILVLLAAAAAFFICAFCYFIVLKFLSLKETKKLPQAENAVLAMLLLPMLFFCTAELYILQTSYTQTICTDSLLAHSMTDVGKHIALLFLQILGLGGLLCTLYAYRRIRQGFQTQSALDSLSQASRSQQKYVAEAKLRYEQTKAFRHDIKNHLAVLNGLLAKENSEEARAYLQKLERISDSLSFPYQTGNPVVDILLGEKLSLATSDDIKTDISLILPKPCIIDDFDLCVIFANALDNAVDACRFADGDKAIRIVGKRQGDFYMLEFENTCPNTPLPSMGTGLSNIKTITEKYHGTMLTEKKGPQFSLNVLLNISLHPEHISNQKP